MAVKTISFSPADVNNLKKKEKLYAKYEVKPTYKPEDYLLSLNNHPEFEMVNLMEAVPDAKFNILYATDNNFTGTKVYEKPECWARKPLAITLNNIVEELKKKNIGVLVWDGYRPYSVAAFFFDCFPNPDYVIHPKVGSRHCRGCAIDLTLYDLSNGKEWEMPTEFDSFSEFAHHNYYDLPENIIRNREFLADVMKRHGFNLLNSEWWHFDLEGHENFPLLDLSFEQLHELKR